MKIVFVVQIYSTLTNKMYYNLIKNANIFPGWMVEIRLQNAPDCLREHAIYKIFPGEHAPGPP